MNALLCRPGSCREPAGRGWSTCYPKLGVSNRAEAIALALRHNFLQQPPHRLSTWPITISPRWPMPLGDRSCILEPAHEVGDWFLTGPERMTPADERREVRFALRALLQRVDMEVVSQSAKARDLIALAEAESLCRAT